MVKFRKVITIAYVTAICLFLCSCASGETIAIANKKDTGFIVTKAGMYDSADDNAVIVTKDTANKTITFYDRLVKKQYTLNYDGASKLYDKYGTSLSMEQIEPGMIVNTTFLKTKKLLNSLQLSDTAWVMDQTTDFTINEKAGTIALNNGVFTLSDKLLVYSEGRQAELMDVNAVDTITVCGIDRMAYSIIVNKGHGYLRLRNEDYFVGGWIEVGSKIIRTIGQDMLLAVPEGSYEVLLSQGRVEDSMPVTISRNQETELDLSEIEIAEEQIYGNLIIATTPADAEVYLDGELVDHTVPVKTEYGIHQLIIRANGYQTMTQYIKVGQENATLDITLEKEIDYSDVPYTVSPSPVPSLSPVPTQIAAIAPQAVSGYKITIATPVSAEVYLDGNYIGLSPISFAKTTGNHEIILRKEGYVTRSYTISIDNTKQDEIFSFSDLVSNIPTPIVTEAPTKPAEPQITVYVTSYPTPVPTVEPTKEPEAEITPEVTPEIKPTPEITPEAE